MTAITFYRRAAALPIVLPIFAYAIAWHTSPGGVLPGIARLVLLSGLAGGPAYVPFICGLLWLLRGRTADAYWYASLVAPLLFAPVFILYLAVLGYFLPSPEPFIDNVLFYLRYLLGVGYAYVVLVHLLRLGLSRRGWFNERQTAV
jgi:hypothetical protein